MGKQITLNGIIGLGLAAFGAVVYIWTYSMPLRPNEVIQPRVAMALFMIGGVWIFLTELRTPNKEYIKLEKDPLLLLVVAGVSAAAYLYGQALLWLGAASSVFLFLVLWWLFSTYREAKQADDLSSFLPRFGKHVVLAAAVSGGVYVLFIVFLRMYLPGILLF